MPEPAHAASGWMSDALARAWRGLRLWTRTWSGVLFTPRQFALGWLQGSRSATNPLAFMASVLGISVLVHQLDPLRGRADGDISTWLWLLIACGPYLNFLVVALFAHFGAKALRGKARLAESLGLVLFIGGTVVLLLEIGFEAAVLLYRRATGLEVPQLQRFGLWALTGAIGLFLLHYIAMTAAAHAIRWWRAALAVLAAFALVGALIGLTGITLGLFLVWVMRDPAGQWHLVWAPGWLHGG